MKLKFQEKVLIPVVVVLVLFDVATLGLFSSRSRSQMLASAQLQGNYLKARFADNLASRTNQLITAVTAHISQPLFFLYAEEMEYRRQKDPKGITPDDLEALHESMRDTFTQLFKNLGEEADVALMELPGGQTVTFSRGPGTSGSEFQAQATNAIAAVFNGTNSAPHTGRIIYDGKLHDVICLPCFGTTTNDFLGVVCVGVAMDRSFIQNIKAGDSELALVADNRVIGSTFQSAPAEADLLRAYLDPGDLTIQDQHFVGLAGTFPLLNGVGHAGYLLLASYELPWQDFRQTLRELILLSVIGILVGATVVWWLVRRATQPLRTLRDSAEAVGRGDFSKRITLATDDELGELAAVFNQMTENLQKSTAQLEKTVEILRTTQAQLVHTEKLSVVGEFVAGVAHELNNPLTALIGFSELLLMGDPDPESRDALKRISNSAERCHKIVQSLLGFARQHAPERKPTNINAVVDAVLEILIYELRTSNITLTKEYAENLPRLMIDPHQIQQVFLNIVNNARQAIEAHQAKGAIKIITRAVGARVQVRFEDDGPGISPENLSKIFNPFFTTKPVGKGTGLGLSLSYGIIQEHGGTITAESKIGLGTTFIVEFPVTAGAENGASHAPAVAVAARAAAARKGNGRKILLVDDEVDILELLSKILEHDGYIVAKAHDGEKALGCLAHQSFDLIITDWKMPGMSGPQLHDQLLQTNREAADRMIFMTGDVLSEKVANYLKEHRRPCIGKPFSLQDFNAVVNANFEKKSQTTNGSMT